LHLMVMLGKKLRFARAFVTAPSARLGAAWGRRR